MDKTADWHDLMHEAQTILLRGQEIDAFKPNIQLAIQPSFDNSFFLQLIVNDNTVYWYRTTWFKPLDAPKFYDPIESLKYIGQKITPTIKFEHGEISKEKLTEIIDFAQTMNVRPQLEKWGGIMLDGVYYTLIIGVENLQTKYDWRYLPDAWNDLQKLTNMLKKLNQELL